MTISRMKIIFPFLLLFVARLAFSSNFDGSLILSSHSDEPTEWDRVELTCNITLTSSPATNRTKLYYCWTLYDILVDSYWESYPNSNGPAVDNDGNIRPGYSFKDDGRTLVIDSVRYYDNHFGCQGSEDGNSYSDAFGYCLQIRHKPYFDQLMPPSKKVIAAIGETASMYFACQTYPSHLPNGSWTFVNLVGVSKNLPSNSHTGFDVYDCGGYCDFEFKLISAEYYGNYSFNMTNDVGSATITFQVIPEGPPDAPSNVRIQYVTDNTIVVEWNVMWSNSHDGRQTVYCKLVEVEFEIILESSSTSYEHNEDYNRTYRYEFEMNIQWEINYKVSVWSMNKFGTSQVVEMEVEIQNGRNLIFTTEAISISKTKAIVNIASPPPISLWVILGITSTASVVGLLP